MRIFFNEIDAYAAAWLQNLYPDDTVDQRSISDVKGTDVTGFSRVHLFAGIGGWEQALRLACVPAEMPVWTGSCPCQPFSVAGKKSGTADERHLWPEMRRLIDECKPSIVFGEQVASPLGREWLAGVRSDLEGMGYHVGAADLPAGGVGAPHRRSRLWWGAALADAQHQGPQRPVLTGRRKAARQTDRSRIAGTSGKRPCEFCGYEFPESCGRYGCPNCCADGLADSNSNGCHQGRGSVSEAGNDGSVGNCGLGMLADSEAAIRGTAPQSASAGQRRNDSQVGGRSGTGIPLGNAIDTRLEGHAEHGDDRHESGRIGATTDGPVATSGVPVNFWSDSIAIPCLDGKARRIKPSIFPLAHGVSGRMAVVRTRQDGQEETHWYSRVGTLRGAGNAIVPQVAAVFVRAFLEAVLS